MWASAAEGFFLFSGLLVGRLRGQQVEREGIWAATRACWRRALTLLATSCVLTLAFTVAARDLRFDPGLSRGLSVGGWPEVVWRTLTVRYTYGLADMLPLYGMYLALSPLALLLLRRGKGALVMGASAAVWALSVVHKPTFHLTGSYLSEPSWQLVFFAGVTLGHGWRDETWRALAASAATVRALAAASLALLALSWVHVYAGVAPPAISHQLAFAFDNVRLGPGRVVVAAVWLATVYLLVRRHEARLAGALGLLLLPLGQSSLYVYVVHSVLVFPLLALPSRGVAEATLRGAACLLVIWACVRNRVLFGVIPR